MKHSFNKHSLYATALLVTLALFPSVALGQAEPLNRYATRLDGAGGLSVITCTPPLSCAVTVPMVFSISATPSFTSVTASGLAAGEVVYTGTGGLLSVDSAATYNATTKALAIPTGSVSAANLTATGLTATTVSAVTPTLSKFSTLTVVQGSDLADGDYFTLSDGTAKVFEFDTGGGVTAGRVAITITGSETPTEIRDLVVIAVNNSGILATAVAAAADTLTVTLTTPGSAGGVNSENVSNAGFLVPVWGDPTHATTYGYKAAAYLPDGTSNAASTEVTTATGHATLSAANYNAVSWAASSGAALYKLWRTTGGAAPPKLIYSGTALAFNDVGTAGSATTPPVANMTGLTLTGQYRLVDLNTAPANAGDTGTKGEIRIAADGFYVCTATNTWVKVALATW